MILFSIVDNFYYHGYRKLVCKIHVALIYRLAVCFVWHMVLVNIQLLWLSSQGRNNAQLNFGNNEFHENKSVEIWLSTLVWSSLFHDTKYFKTFYRIVPRDCNSNQHEYNKVKSKKKSIEST